MLKGNGTPVVTGQVLALSAVLDDGRVIASRFGDGGDGFVVVDGSGHELSRLSNPPGFAGLMSTLPGATTMVGNDAYVASSARTLSTSGRSSCSTSTTARSGPGSGA